MDKEEKYLKKLDIEKILENLENYRPRRKGWTWRQKTNDLKMGDFNYVQCSIPLKNSVPLPAAHEVGGIDPQPDCVITSEIAWLFEDDIRRMRMAAWHGADHIMVIRTLGQSHIDGLVEGTPRGIGGVPISRKQIRATRKALDFIEDEVGRPINFHTYVSGVAGPLMAVLCAEEGVNGAHQDPQYNILYRNINMVRSFIDAAEAKKIMASANLAQIDGAHNANATAVKAWKVMPELLVQHAINCAYSVRSGMPKDNICLSTVPPAATPAPDLYINLPYAVAVRQLFKGFRMRAQMNTKYMQSDTREATVIHTLNTLISRLTNADIQSTITPDEGRNIPWHYNSISGINTAKQALIGLDGLTEMVQLKTDGVLNRKVREIKERAVLFLEEMLEIGGYFAAVEAGFFVDSGCYPEREGDAIIRHINGGEAAGAVVPRDAEYMAPVCSHFGNNMLPEGLNKPCDLINGCTLCNPDKIVYIDELDPEDNVNERLMKTRDERKAGIIRPEVAEWGDGTVLVSMLLPTSEKIARFAALEMARQMGLKEPEVIHRLVMHPAEGTYVEVKGQVDIAINPDKLEIAEEMPLVDEGDIKQEIKSKPFKVVAATLGHDEHSVGIREVLDIKHGGLEKYGIECNFIGTSISPERLADAAIEMDAGAILASTIITHGDVHRLNMQKLHDICVEKGVRDKILLIGGGTQVTDEMAKAAGLDAGFGRGTAGHAIASFIVRVLREKKS
ncbi:D-ornithine 4,5-aminomutase subunit OraE [Chloroflexota bacterium]